MILQLNYDLNSIVDVYIKRIILLLIDENKLMLLKASRIFGSLLHRTAQPYGVTPQMTHDLSA